MSRHIENSGIVRTVYSGIFRDIQQDLAIFRHTEAYSGIIEAYEVIIRHFRNSA